MPWYKSGTVSVVQNSNAVIGTGTSFIANGRVGDAFLGPDGRWYEVTNIASDTAMSISPNYLGADDSADTYALAPMQGYVKDSADQLRALVSKFGTLAATPSINALAGLTGLAGRFAYFTAPDQMALAPLSDYARSGANSDITALAGLTSPLSINQGGTGRNDGLAWGNLKGALSNQTDLQATLNAKVTGSKQGLVTASVLFSGVGPTIINNFNVASITKVTTGIYEINFSSPMDNTAFFVVGMACDDSAVQSIMYENGASASTRTLSKVRVVSGVPGASTRDFSLMSVIVVGGKN